MGKIFLRFILSIFCIFVILVNAQENQEVSIFEHENQENSQVVEENQNPLIPLEVVSIQNLQENLDNQKVIFNKDELITNLRNENNIIVRYEQAPSKVFLKQQFEINLRATIATDDYDYILTSFEGGNGYEIINKESKWLWQNSRFFTNKFIVKVKNLDFILPDIVVSLVKNNTIVEEFKLNSVQIDVSSVGNQLEHFSFVIAKDLKLISHFTRQYDNNTLLTLLEIEASQSNLEDFKFKNIQKQGIESFVGDFDNQKLIYYAIVPIHYDKIVFSYYNTTTSKIEMVSSAIVHTNDIVSTQTDLNPHTSEILFYKKIAFGILSVLAIVIFIIFRNKLTFLLMVIIISIFGYLYMPNNNIVVPKNINVFILPTKSSSVFFKTDKELNVEVLDKKRGYIKILLPDDKIGWIDEKDLIKN